ncbi:uncharacterized protein LOC106178695 [Lingula anatina]|uniref:Uncharacterized protein LOC106178695 n=1 Tax=Lingula anatina TaxID=7574 RepID=A0A1S3K4J2_LINAN|nr:uncharacterized protein LOC106178695 [Lingula anatina]|eukprot:XP_013417442.1 uncharacterized protein LOC106178695 [Lingula anatina]
MTSKLLHIPGSAGLPVVGDKSYEYYKDAVQFVLKRIDQHHSRIFISRLLNTPTVFVADHSMVNELLKDHGEHLEFGYKVFMHNVLGDNILFANGEEADNIRKIFHRLLDETTVGHFQDIVERLVEKHLQGVETRETICAYTMVKKLATEICLTLFLGVDFEESKELASRICELTTTHWHGIISVPVNFRVPFGTSSTYSKALEAKKLLLEIIQTKLHAEDTDATFPLQVREAGFKTPILAANHLLLLTSALVPKALASLVTSFVLVTSQWMSKYEIEDMLDNQKHFDAVLLEVQRLWPPFAGGRRVVKKDLVLSAGYRIPHGHAVLYCTHASHRDPKVFPDPDNFRPDRWSNSSLSKDSLFCFGGGARDCVGQHIMWNMLRTICTSLISQFTWELEEGQCLEYKWLPVSRPKDKVKAKFTRK